MPATAESTARYHERNALLSGFPLATARLGRTGLLVSRAGFGGYRVAAGVPAHRAALRAALVAGINLIDTSANYADGASEVLIGETLRELVEQRAIARSEVVVVTKAGYIQGGNMAVARERIEAGGGFPEVVEYGPGLWHCIAPEFLEDQLTRSLDRLGMSSVDVLLLHNPEYYLSWAAKHGVPLAEARAEYERRIANAFAYLEGEVERGRIGWYGISSNSFPHAADAADFTSLERMVGIAERISLIHHFAVIQLPANLIERGFVTEANQAEGRTVLDVARTKQLGVLINRPLNAITDDGLIRLADFPAAREPFDEVELERLLDGLRAEEAAFRAERLPVIADGEETAAGLGEYVAMGALLGEHWREIGSIERLNDIGGQVIAPRLGAVRAYLEELGDAAQSEWFEGYVARVRAALDLAGRFYARIAQRRSDALRAQITTALGGEATVEGTLSSLAIRLLLGADGVTSVLVGMRREEYVDDVVGALREKDLGSWILDLRP